MLNIMLKDGSIIQVEEGYKVYDIAMKISPALAKKALSATVNGEVAELMTNLNCDCSLEILTFEDAEGEVFKTYSSSYT